MPYEVKMPQLGMNQDSAVIVSWLKAAGDEVAKGDAIFEVETDKATMEVEAATGGYLAGIVAGEGDDVPVGDLIALIVESEADVANHAGVTAKPAAEPEPTFTEHSAEKEPVPEPLAETPQLTTKATVSGKVLASPLAKELAKARGIDLAAMRAQGVDEPIHAADLTAATMGGQSQLSAKVDGSALNALLSRSEETNRATLFCAFAAGGWRSVFGKGDIAIAIQALDGSVTTYTKPDEARDGATAASALRLIDLCDTRLGTYAPAGGGITLTIAKNDTDFTLTLSFSEGTLPFPSAIALLDAIAARIEDPIRQLL
jgi:pyruvate/2-oxoglutarate dehydrogenase complex dihydrolipoamide acyltransferase (E2) component